MITDLPRTGDKLILFDCTGEQIVKPAWRNKTFLLFFHDDLFLVSNIFYFTFTIMVRSRNYNYIVTLNILFFKWIVKSSTILHYTHKKKKVKATQKSVTLLWRQKAHHLLFLDAICFHYMRFPWPRAKVKHIRNNALLQHRYNNNMSLSKPFGKLCDVNKVTL